MDEELREGTTPRPWIVADETVTEHGAEVAIIEAGVSIARPLDESLIEPGDPRADADLIVEAVNDHDRLRRIEKAAREFIPSYEKAEGEHPAHESSCTFCALRTALGED